MVTVVYILEKHEIEPVAKTIQVLYEIEKLEGVDQQRQDAIGILEDLLDHTRAIRGRWG